MSQIVRTGLIAVAALLAVAGPRARADGDPLPPHAVARLGVPAMHLGEAVTDLAFSPDGRLLAAADGYALTLWDATTGRLRRRHRDKHFESLFAVAFSPGGRHLAAGDR